MRALRGARGSRLPIQLALIASLLGAAVIHAAQIQEHFEEWWAAGSFFVVITVVEVGVAAWAAKTQSRSAYWVAMFSSAVALLVWGVSRSIGLPFGPERWLPERVGRPDVAADVLEAITIIAAALLLSDRLRRPAGAFAAVATPLILVVIVGLIGVGLTPTEECATHGGEWPFGPLVPVDGHAMVYRTTPSTPARAGERIGVVVGYLKNCGARDVILQDVDLTSTGDSGSVASIRVVPANGVVGSTNEVSVNEFEHEGVAVDGTHVPPTGEEPTLALVALLNVDDVSHRSGGFFINAVFVRYNIGWRSFRAPFGSAARLELAGSV